MSTENQIPQRRPGPHTPLPGVAAAVGEAIKSDAPPSAAPVEREDDPRVRAAKRAAELREHLAGNEDNANEFYIDPRIIPEGWSYEYRTLTVLGKEDPSYQVNLARRGWEAVPRSRHPELMPTNYTGETIIRSGQILMERPLEITEESKMRDRRNAREQVRGKEIQLGAAPAGTFDRDNKGNPLASVKKSYESIPIPE